MAPFNLDCRSHGAVLSLTCNACWLVLSAAAERISMSMTVLFRDSKTPTVLCAAPSTRCLTASKLDTSSDMVRMYSGTLPAVSATTAQHFTCSFDRLTDLKTLLIRTEIQKKTLTFCYIVFCNKYKRWTNIDLGI